jgi:hypothetical protein
MVTDTRFIVLVGVLENSPVWPGKAKSILLEVVFVWGGKVASLK